MHSSESGLVRIVIHQHPVFLYLAPVRPAARKDFTLSAHSAVVRLLPLMHANTLVPRG